LFQWEHHTITLSKYTLFALFFHIHTEICPCQWETPIWPSESHVQNCCVTENCGLLGSGSESLWWMTSERWIAINGGAYQQQSMGTKEASNKWDTVYYYPRVSTSISQLHVTSSVQLFWWTQQTQEHLNVSSTIKQWSK
jgi:hypothetical protein